MLLIVHKSKKQAEEVADIFRYMGIVALGTTPPDALHRVAPCFHSVLICDPFTIPDVPDYLRRMRSYFSSPIFCLSTENRGIPELAEYFDGTFPDGSYSSDIAVDMGNICKRMGIAPAGVYRLAGIDASCDIGSVTFLDDPVTLTKTESMILRFLMSTYPAPQPAKVIIEHAFYSKRRPNPAVVRTHVSSMNKKYRAATDRTLIVCIHGKGYAVSTPDLREKYGIRRAQPAAKVKK